MSFSLSKSLSELTMAILAILASTVTVVLVSAPPASAFVVTAVFPPWWSAEDVRRVVTPMGAAASNGRTPNVITVYGGADLQSRLHEAGVWLILDPRLLTCGSSPDFSA